MSVSVAQVRTQIADRPQYYPPAAASPEIIGYGDGASTIFSLTYENYIPGTLTLYTAAAPAAGAAPSFVGLSPNSPISVATTSAGATSIGVSTITPGSMASITVGAWVRLDPGLVTQEDCLVTAVTGTTFTCVTTYAHAAGFSIVGSPTYSVGGVSTGLDGTNATNQVIIFQTAPAAGTIIGARYQVTAFSDADLTFYLDAAVALAYPDDLTTLKRVQFDIIPVILGDQRRMAILSEGAFKNDPSSFRAALTSLRAELAADLEGGPLPQTNVPQLGVMVRGAHRYEPYR
jgi:hypothetical protein